MATSELSLQLERQGIRNLSSSDVWLACQDHGLADLVDDKWIPRGWAPVSHPVHHGALPGPESRPAQRVRPRDPDSLTRKDRAEIDRLRVLVRLESAESTAVAPVPSGWPALAGAAAQGLTDELEAVSKRRTQTDVTIRGGHVVAIGQSRVVMRFEADSEVPGRDGMSATLVVDGASFDVEIISLFGSVVTVSLGQDAPRPRTAKLRCDLSWLLTAQSRRLRELAGGAPGFDPAAAMAVVSAGCGTAAIATRDHPTWSECSAIAGR